MQSRGSWKLIQSTFFAAGEAVQLIVAPREIIPSPPYIKDASFNRGMHVLHFGRDRDSFLLVPKIPAIEADRAKAGMVQ